MNLPQIQFLFWFFDFILQSKWFFSLSEHFAFWWQFDRNDSSKDENKKMDSISKGDSWIWCCVLTTPTLYLLNWQAPLRVLDINNFEIEFKRNLNLFPKMNSVHCQLWMGNVSFRKINSLQFAYSMKVFLFHFRIVCSWNHTWPRILSSPRSTKWAKIHKQFV